jgi:hypothetical protein
MAVISALSLSLTVDYPESFFTQPMRRGLNQLQQ